MNPVRITLCPECDHCPSVEIDDFGVRIGEDGTSVTLSHAVWNDLVDRIRRGELNSI